MAPIIIESNLVTSSPFRNGDYRCPPAMPPASKASSPTIKNGTIAASNNNNNIVIDHHTNDHTDEQQQEQQHATNGHSNKNVHFGQHQLTAINNNNTGNGNISSLATLNNKASPTPSVASSGGNGVAGGIHSVFGVAGKLTPTRSNSHHAPDLSAQFTWRVGLINHSNHYLTAESFGNKVNVSGASLRKKQVWTVVPVPNGAPNVAYLMSHLNHYISVDEYGDVSCNATEPGERERFVIEEGGDGRTKWAFFHERLQQYLTGHHDRLTCKAKTLTASEEWSVHLAVHPQVSLKSVGRKRYARLCGTEIVFDQDIPWTEASLLTLEFEQSQSGGRYLVKSCDGQILHPDGKLLARATRDCLFTLCYYASQLALRDSRDRYLTPFGSNGILMARNTSITRAELFVLEDNRPQAYFRSKTGRFVSTKQGMEVSANQEEVTEHETFQLEYNSERSLWRLRTYENTYWSLVNNGAIRASEKEENDSTLFDLIWLDNGHVVLRAFLTCKYVAAKPTGQLTALADSVDGAEQFRFFLCNRPLLVLKCAFGYVGFKAGSEVLECNKSTYDALWLEFGQAGEAYLKDMREKYLAVNDDNLICVDSNKPAAGNRFQIQLSRQSKMIIRAPNGKYIVGEQNGLFRAIGDEADAATLWEF